MSNIEAVDMAPEEMVQALESHYRGELAGDMHSNMSAIEVDRLIASALVRGDTVLRRSLAKALGKKPTDAELTFRGQLGLLLLLPTDILNDPIRNKGDRDKRGNYAKDRGEKYYRGRVRLYAKVASARLGISPSLAVKNLAEGSATLTHAIQQMDAEIENHVAAERNRKANKPIENYLAAEASIRTALSLLSNNGKDGVPGNLAEAKARADAIITAAAEFVAECNRQGV